MRWCILAILSICLLHADILTVPLQDTGPISTIYFPEFNEEEGFFFTLFDRALGKLNSATIFLNVEGVVLEHYVTGPTDGRLIPFNFSQTATAEIQGFSTSITQYASTTVVGQICHSCGVGIPFDLHVGGAVPDPSLFSAWSHGLPITGTIFGQITVTPGPIIGDLDTALLTDEFLSQGGQGPIFTGSVTYSYTPVPEPRWIGPLWSLVVLVISAGRRPK